LLPLDTMYGKLFLMSCDYIDSPACTAQNTHNNIHCTLIKKHTLADFILLVLNSYMITMQTSARQLQLKGCP